MLKFVTKLDYLLRETMLGLRRGGWMNWAAVSTVTVLLFLFGIGLQTSWQLNGLLSKFGSQLEVSAYLDSGIEARVIQPVVQAIPGVAGVQARSKEEAWADLIADLGISDIQEATAQLNGNPLVDELRVKVAHPSQVPALAEQLRQVEGINNVQYADEAVKQIANLNRGLGWISLVVTSVLTLTAIAVITTTIRLIVMARRQEIEIMQIVGATTRWIYLPFLLQGVIFGAVGATIAWALISSAQKFISSLLARQPDFIQFMAEGLQLNLVESILLPVILLSFGSAVGFLGSILAVRRVALKRA